VTVSPLPAGSRILAESVSPWSDALNDLLQPPVAELRQTVSVNVTSGGTGVLMTFTTEDIDTAGGHSNVSNTGRYTSTVWGYYLLGGAVSFASNATGRRGCWWRKNGTVLDGSEIVMAAGSNIVTVPARSKIVELDVGDYVEMIAFQDSGSTLATAVTATQQPTMSVRLVSYLS